MKPIRPTRLALPLAALLVLLLPACQSGPGEGMKHARPDPLLLISIDGFRHDYIERFDSPTIDRIIREGMRADSLHTVFPTKTFPTHYSIVTGLHPGTHGVVANNMWDPRRDARFSLGDREAVNDGFWYQGGEPIWVTAENQGRTAATFFWPGSEARIRRVRPTFFRPYDGSVPHAERIDQVLEWLALPEDRRPDFLTLYFSAVDSRGHADGPASESALEAAADVDHHLGVLFDRLERRGWLDRINIILVSDHGMATVSRDRTIALDEHLDLSKVRVSDWGPAAQIWAQATSPGEIVAALEEVPHLTAWRREDIPERYRFGSHWRVPDVLVEADPGWLISSAPYMANPNPPEGMHGWDPAVADMHGLFLARGPAFAAGVRAPAVRSVDLYALMTHLLDLDAAEHEGTLDPFRPYLEPASAPEYSAARFACEQGPVEARIAPRHLALHVGERIHVLPRVEAAGEGRRYQAAGLSFTIAGERATGRIGDKRLSGCRAAGG